MNDLVTVHLPPFLKCQFPALKDLLHDSTGFHAVYRAALMHHSVISIPFHRQYKLRIPKHRNVRIMECSPFRLLTVGT